AGPICQCGGNDSCFVSSRRRHTKSKRDWSSDVCSSDLCKVYYFFTWISNIIRTIFIKKRSFFYRFWLFSSIPWIKIPIIFISFRSEERRVGEECRHGVRLTE